MAEALIALGGNLGEPRATLARALAKFCDGADVRLLVRSCDYRTAPWGITAQPPFINLCALVTTDLPLHALLARALEVERAFGRDRARSPRWGPRVVDIDILAYDDLIITTPELTVPHPRLFERAFVLVPLAEIAPERVIAGRRVREALAGVETTGIEKLPPP